MLCAPLPTHFQRITRQPTQQHPNHKPTKPSSLTSSPRKQVQTPQQRRANEAYAKSEAAKRGKPQTEVERIMERKKASKIGAQKSPVSKVWLCKFSTYPREIESGMGENAEMKERNADEWYD